MGLRPRRTTLAAVVMVGLAGLSGCGSEPPPAPPSGVDGLTIPTPSPDPRDFTHRVTNRWLPLVPGHSWTYAADDGATREVSVTNELVEVAGVTAVEVATRETSATGAATDSFYEFYAQDRFGNVWLLGRKVDRGPLPDWQAGVDGAQAGLAMAAVPRRGDGYAVADARGADEDRAIVLSLDASAATPAGTYDHALLVEYTSVLDPGSVVRRTYARGVGLVSEVGVQGALGQWELTATDPGLPASESPD